MLDAAAEDRGPAVFILRDVHRLGGDVRGHAPDSPPRPAGSATRPVRVVLLTPPGDLPPDLAHDVPTALYALPSFEALVAIVEEELARAARLRPTRRGWSPRPCRA